MRSLEAWGMIPATVQVFGWSVVAFATLEPLVGVRNLRLEVWAPIGLNPFKGL